jgi:hypothetical protein
MRNLILCLSGSVLAAVCVFGSGVMRAQTPLDKQVEAGQAARAKIYEQLPIIDFNTSESTTASEQSRREEKGKRYNFGQSPITESMGGGGVERTYHWPESFPALPVAESTTIIVGRVSNAQAHLSANKSGVYSEVTITIDEVLKDKMGIKLGASIIAEREGGRVRFSSGSLYSHYVVGRGIPRVGGCYLFFLERINDGDFLILTAYQFLENRVIPLDDSRSAHFEQYKGSDETTFKNEVKDNLKLN